MSVGCALIMTFAENSSNGFSLLPSHLSFCSVYYRFVSVSTRFFKRGLRYPPSNFEGEPSKDILRNEHGRAHRQENQTYTRNSDEHVFIISIIYYIP